MKTEQDLALDKALERYMDRFDAGYPIFIGHRSRFTNSADIIKRIDECIANGTPEDNDPGYKPDMDY